MKTDITLIAFAMSAKLDPIQRRAILGHVIGGEKFGSRQPHHGNWDALKIKSDPSNAVCTAQPKIN